MNNGLFRKASMDRVNSPEQLNQHIRAARPGVWVILSAVVLLLAGIIVFFVFVTIETDVYTSVLVSGGKTVCYVCDSDAGVLEAGMFVNIGDAVGRVLSVSESPEQVPDGSDAYLLYSGGYSVGDFMYAVDIDATGIADGVYKAEIVVEVVHPITFIIH